TAWSCRKPTPILRTRGEAQPSVAGLAWLCYRRVGAKRKKGHGPISRWQSSLRVTTPPPGAGSDRRGVGGSWRHDRQAIPRPRDLERSSDGPRAVDDAQPRGVVCAGVVDLQQHVDAGGGEHAEPAEIDDDEGGVAACDSGELALQHRAGGAVEPPDRRQEVHPGGSPTDY